MFPLKMGNGLPTQRIYFQRANDSKAIVGMNARGCLRVQLLQLPMEHPATLPIRLFLKGQAQLGVCRGAPEKPPGQSLQVEACPSNDENRGLSPMQFAGDFIRLLAK